MEFITGNISYIAFAVVAYVLYSSRQGGSSGSGTTQVLRTFKVDENPGDGVYVEIVGRPKGFMAWLLTAIGMDATTTLRVTRKELSIRTASLQGEKREVIPLLQISNTYCSYSKSIWLLAIGVLLALIGLYAIVTSEGFVPKSSIFEFVAGAIFLAFYWFSKKLTLGVQSNSGHPLGITFVRNVIENVPVDIERASFAIQVINTLVTETRHSAGGSPNVSVAAARPGMTSAAASAPAAAPRSMAGKCPKCSAAVTPGSAFCESCGTRVA